MLCGTFLEELSPSSRSKIHLPGCLLKVGVKLGALELRPSTNINPVQEPHAVLIARVLAVAEGREVPFVAVGIPRVRARASFGK